MARFSFLLLAPSLALATAVCSTACMNDVELAFGGCEVDGKTIAVGVPATGPCGEECVCARGGQLECGPSRCVDPDPDPVPQPCVVGNVSIPPGESVLVEASCQTCSCPAAGATEGQGATCVEYKKPACMGLPPGCTELTEETCTRCPECSCQEPPMGCPPPTPDCFYPYQGLCSMNGGDYCGEIVCMPPLCPPSPPVGIVDPACRVSLMCDPNLGWSKRTQCACGDIEPCEMQMPMDPNCRLQASCNPQQPMELLCEETCQCDDPQMCLFPFVFEASFINPMCGACRMCAPPDALDCPMGYIQSADPMTMCGTCVPM